MKLGDIPLLSWQKEQRLKSFLALEFKNLERRTWYLEFDFFIFAKNKKNANRTLCFFN